MDENVGHYCGIVGMYNVPNAAKKAYVGLFSLQHRGQESAGIVTSDGKKFHVKKGMGLVSEVFSPEDLNALPGHIAIGHCRYSTAGSSQMANVQPLVMNYARGMIAVAHNGTLINARRLRDEFEAYGSIFQTSSDSEIIIHLLARPEFVKSADALAESLRRIEGAFSFLFMTEKTLIAARDRFGFRPLVLGKIDDPDQLGNIGEAYVIASETCALDTVGATFIRSIVPGEIVRIDETGLHSSYFHEPGKSRHAHCMFEHVYFARPDSIIFDDSVHEVRVRLGMRLAQEHAVDADVVIPIPDSGNSAAIGYSRQSGIPYDMGFIRSHYVGRSFINPLQNQREKTVDLKLKPVRSVVQGKRVIVIDDSLVRGTTARRQARMLREAGAKEIHLRICCPPTRHACYYGIDFPTRDELIAARLPSVQAIAEFIGVDSLGYIGVNGLLSCVSKPKEQYCTACWSGEYPVDPVDEMHKGRMEKGTTL